MALLTARLLWLLAVLFAVTPGLTRSIGKEVPKLVIDSSVELERPIFGETVGPISAGQELTLTCTIEGVPSASLSWWENGVEMASSSRRENDISGASITVQKLQLSDSGRSLTCREKETGQTKLVVLLIVDTLDIVSGSFDIIDREIIQVENGAELRLNCILQGFSPASVSWWEGDTRLPATPGESQYASSSLLALAKVTAADSGRRFTCQSQGQELPRTIRLQVNGDDAGGFSRIASRPEDPMIDIKAIMTQTPSILLIVSCVMLILLLLTVVAVVVVVCCNKDRSHTQDENITQNNKFLKPNGYVPIVANDDCKQQKARKNKFLVVSLPTDVHGVIHPVSDI